MGRNSETSAGPGSNGQAADRTALDIQKLVDLGAAQAVVKPLTSDRHAVIVVPSGYSAQLVERHDGAPEVKRGTVAFKDEASFSDFVKQHMTPETHLFFDGVGCTLVCVFDHHCQSDKGQPGAARAGLFRAVCEPPLDEDWRAWNGIDNKLLGQLDFVYFLEDHMKNVVDPDAALLMELLATLEATSAGRAASFHRISDGSRRIEFSENVEAKVGGAGGKAAVPKELKLKLPVFRWGGGDYEITAKLRIRLIEGSLKLAIHLDRPQDVIDEAFGRVREAIRTETGLRDHHGTPAAAEDMAPRIVVRAADGRH